MWTMNNTSKPDAFLGRTPPALNSYISEPQPISLEQQFSKEIDSKIDSTNNTLRIGCYKIG